MSDPRRWRSCPICGGSLEPDGSDGAVVCESCGERAYANPAPTASAIPIDAKGRLLLARRAHEPRAGCWDALGGFIEPGESASDALIRELREETGAEFVPLAFLGAFPDSYGPGGAATLNLYWTARHVAGGLEPADDVAELRWFMPEELPAPEELAFANNALAVEAALRARPAETDEAPGPDPPGMFEVQLVSDGLDRLAGFYADTVGLRTIVDDRERGRVHFALRRGQLILARLLGEDASPEWPGLPPPLLSPADAKGRTPTAHGPIHFALEVEGATLIAEGERLRRAGLDVRGPFRWPDGYRSSYFRDPDGNVVELIAAPAGSAGRSLVEGAEAPSTGSELGAE